MFQVGVNDVKKSTVKKARRSRKVLQPRHNRNVPASSTTSFPSGKGDSLAAEDYDAASVGDELNTSFMSIDESYSDTEKENRSSKSSRKKHKSSVKVGNKSERRRRSGSSSTSSSSSKRQQKRRRVASISTPDKLNTSLFDEEAQTGGDDVDVGDLNLDSSQKKRDRKREREMAREKNVELAKSYKELGNEMYTRNEYARAVEAYSEALKLDSKNPIYLGNRAAAYFMEGKYFHCIADCDAALHADPSYLRARVRLARTLVVVGEVFSVQEHLKIIAGFHGKNSVAFHEEGRQIERLCLDYERAVSECDTFLRTEQVKKCQDLALSALQMCPGSKRLHILLLAVKLMEAAISSVSPSTSSQQESKESVAEVKRELERMMKACEFEAERNQMAVYLYLYGKLLLLCALTSEARLLLSGAQQLAPQEQRIQNKVALVCKMEACLNAGITAVSQRKFEEAIEHFDHALQLDPNNIAFNARMHFRKASANMSLCKFNAAINDCNQTLRLLPDYHKARIRKAHAHMQLGNYSLAVEELQTAYNINPSTSVARELQAARSVLERAERKAREQKEQRESKQQQQQQQQQKQDRPKPSASFKSSSSKPSTPFQYRTRSARKTPKADKKRKSIEMVTCSDHYQVLGVPRRASIGTIKKAFRKKALRYHPDKNMSPNADAKFKRINEAYNTLKSPGKRRTYDLSSGVSSSFF